MPRPVERWRGVALTLVGVVATVGLALSGQLGLYIHPRYFAFTIVMAVVGGLFALAALALARPAAPRGRDDDDGHDHHEHRRPDAAGGAPVGGRTVHAVISVVTIVAAAVAMLAFPPANLTAQTAVQRDIDRTAADLSGDAPSLTGADPSTFTVKDWALLLAHNDDPSAFDGQVASLTGFVTPAPGNPDDLFYVARFSITCCAVDAQPVGVPVYLDGWKEQFSVDDWVDTAGGFAVHPGSGEELVLLPDEIVPTEQPEQPYVF